MTRILLSTLLLAALLCLTLPNLNLSQRANHLGFKLWPGDAFLDTMSGDEYLLGVGKADITGPAVEINFMGYANASQLGSGVRQRLYSRAFIIGDIDDPEARFVYLVLDTQSGDTAVRYGILNALHDLGDDYSMYGQQNVAVTGTHSHSGPGAWLNYLLPQITSKGFHKPSYQAIVDGAVASIKRAHAQLSPGRLSYGEVDIPEVNINRSPYAYLANPADEREGYQNDVDKRLTMLRFSHVHNGVSDDIGVLTWFAVHGTSMLGNNTLITGDNKGVAAWLFETAMHNPGFVAGFSQANVGDTTPNVLGAWCESGEQAGEPCDFQTSLCGNKSEPCRGRGAYFGRNDAGTASAFESGRRQFQGAYDLFQDEGLFTPIRGKMVRSMHKYVDLAGFTFTLPNGTLVTTCPAALGYSFAAGTSDGPGVFDFKQGQPNDPNANPLWAAVGGLIHRPNETQKECQREKVILLDVGESHTPYDWTPNIVDLQLFRVGQMFIIVSPGEATTMAGRRWREALASAAKTMSVNPTEEDALVVLGGPANSYTHYITTPEEYAVQRYEGASTLYGSHTLDAYINLTLAHLPYLSLPADQLAPLDPGPSPPNNVNKSLSFITPVVVDRAGFLRRFGNVLENPDPTYHAGDSISAKFVGANPRNNLRLDATFASVEKYDDDTATWSQIRSDQDWSLVYEWWRTSSVLGTSEVTITWETKWETGSWRESGLDGGSTSHGDLLLRADHNDLAGLYKIRYYGDAKGLDGSITAFEGASAMFRIV